MESSESDSEESEGESEFNNTNISKYGNKGDFLDQLNDNEDEIMDDDYEMEELTRISSDEAAEDRDALIKESNKKKS